RAVVLAADFRPTGLALHFQAEVNEDSKTNAFLKDCQPNALPELSKMPTGSLMYMATHLGARTFREFLPMLYGLYGDKDDKESKDIRAALVALADAEPRSRYDAWSIPIEGLQVAHFADPAKAVAAQLKVFESLQPGSQFSQGMIKDKKVQANAKKYAGFELNRVAITWDLEKMAEKSGAALPPEVRKKMVEGMKAMMGDGVQSWFGTDGKVMLTVSAKDWEKASQIIDQYREGKDTVGDHQAFKAARRELPRESTAIALIDMPRYARVLFDFVK